MCTHQFFHVKQSLCSFWTGMDDKIYSAITSGCIGWDYWSALQLTQFYMSPLLAKNSPSWVDISKPALHSKVNLFGKLLWNIVWVFFRNEAFDGVQERKNKSKSLLAIWTASLHANEVAAKILGVFNESCPLLGRFQWCVPACLGKTMEQNAGGLKKKKLKNKQLLKINLKN